MYHPKAAMVPFDSSNRYALLAIAAAVLFGLSAPLSKLLLRTESPPTLAGLLHLGSGAGLLGVRVFR